MPMAFIMTNVKHDKLPADFKRQVVACVAEICGVPASWCCVLVNSDMDISMSDSEAPAVIFVVRANGVFGPEKNLPLFVKAAEFFNKCLGVEPLRVYSEFAERDEDACGLGTFPIRQCMQMSSGNKQAEGCGAEGCHSGDAMR